MQLVVDGQSYDLDIGALRNDECIALERACDLTLSEWSDRLKRGSMLATTAAIWLIRRRSEPGLKFDDVVFDLGDFDLKLSDDEKRTALASLKGEQREAFLESLPEDEREALVNPTEAGAS